jgi:NAD/NADP transhydrogenase alpha subunit
LGFEILVEEGAGANASYMDIQYRKAGASIESASKVYNADIIIKIRPPSLNELEQMREKSLLISYLYLNENGDLKEKLSEMSNLKVFALECTPRLTRAQKLDTLSSTTNLSGYRAVLEAFSHLPKFSKGQVTAAGKIEPSKVFVIGAGVAGLAAIGVSK